MPSHSSSDSDEGLGERLIRAILEGRKMATSGPAADPEDADVQPGDLLELRDKDGRPRGLLRALAVELRSFGSFDEELAAAEDMTLRELWEGTAFANGRTPAPGEPMRVIRFQLLTRRALPSSGRRTASRNQGPKASRS